MIIRYSRWDGSQRILEMDADDLMDAMGDDLLADGDLWRALQRLFRHGYENREGQRMPGMQNLMERLRQRRQEMLDHYNMSDVLKDIQEKLEQVKQTEREGIQRRLDEGKKKAESGEVPEALQKTLEKMAGEKQQFLDQLPQDMGGQIKSLSDYDFMDQQAREQFQELLQMLQQQLMQSYFQGMQQAIQNLSPEDLNRIRDMVRDLNKMMRDKMRGEEPNFDEFMQKHGDFFPGVQNFDQLMQQLQQQMAQMQSLMESMSPDQRKQLQQMMESVLRDDALRAELAMLAAQMQELMPNRPRRYPFRGDEPVSLQEAMQLMGDLQEMDRLERALRNASTEEDMEGVDRDQVERLLGPEAAEQMDQLQQITKLLEEAGYLERHGDSLELSPRALRKIGQKALQDIFAQLKRDRFGQHEVEKRGRGGDRTDESKAYEFGDPFLLDLKGTLFNSMFREASEALEERGEVIPLAPSPSRRAAPSRAVGSPSIGSGRAGRSAVHLKPQDFDVYKTEYLTSSATVLMLDMSRSMILRGCFLAAKKVAMALNSLIRGQYPRDNLYIVGFSYMAKELKAEALPTLTWNEWVYGTNMQHGFMLSRQLLTRSHAANKQIIMITDGEPTAHFEGGRVEFSYPPTHRTYQETLKEVQRCTRDRVTINTFMLDHSRYLKDLVELMSRLNKGRAFFATPDRLGEYILVDYVRNKRRMVS